MLCYPDTCSKDPLCMAGQCSEKELPVTSLEHYTHVVINEGYSTSLKKIGNSIVFIQSKGSLRSYDIEKFNTVVDSFCLEAGVKKPYVQIRDLQYIQGRVSFKTLQKQRKYFLENQANLLGYISIHEPGWMKVFINHGIKLFKPQMKFYAATNYDEALSRATQMLQEIGFKTHAANTSLKGNVLNPDQIIFKPEWEYYNPSSQYSVKVGAIPGRLFYISMQNKPLSQDELKPALKMVDSVMQENNLNGIKWNINNFNGLKGGWGFKLRSYFLREVNSINHRHHNQQATVIIIGANQLRAILSRLFSFFLSQKMVFVDSVDEAFSYINQRPYQKTSESTDKNDIYVSAADLEEISIACGSLLWDSGDQDKQIEVSENNPLVNFAESLNLIRNDLNELRENEKFQIEQRLKESEENRKQLSALMSKISKAKSELELAEESQRILLNNISTQIWYLTDEQTYGAVNKAHADFLGLHTDEISHKSMYDFLPGDIVETCRQSAREVFKSGKKVIKDEWTGDANGNIRLLLITKTPKLREDGTVEYVVCTAEDISERRLAETQLRQLSRAVEQSPVSIVITDLKGNIEYVNPKFLAVTGYSKEEVIGQNPRVLKSGHQSDDVYNELWNTITNGQTWQGEFHNKKKNGQLYWEMASISPIFDDKRQISHFLAVKEDITQRKISEENLKNAKEKAEKGEIKLQKILYEVQVAEEEVRAANEELWATTNALKENNDALERERAKAKESEEKLSLITDNAFDGIYLMEDQYFTYVNDRFCSITGYSHDELCSADFDFEKLLTEKSKSVVLERYNARKRGETLPGYYESEILCKDGKAKSVEFSTVSIGKTNQLRIIGIVRDITIRKLAEMEAKQKEELEKKIAVTRESLVFKQNFLANMSHEIRTPLTGILGMIEILNESGLTPKQKEYLAIVQQSGESLRSIVNDVLDFSKIEAGKLSLNKHPFEFSHVTRRAENLFNALCKKPVKFVSDYSSQIPEFILADENRISQIITNFISNAVKFTMEGEVILSTGLLKKDETSGQLVLKVSVTDTGIGISEEKQHQLFQPFSQIERTDTRQFDGTGLGLAICKELAHLHGGKIGLSSAPGRGSTFWFTFLAHEGEQQEMEKTLDESARDKPQTRKLTILLVEDTQVNQKVIGLMLKALGHTVTIASNGQFALELYKPGSFNLILMDIQMPVMDGITATGLLKQKYDDLPPIVGLSANAFEGDREKYMARGLDEYITKPVKKDDFLMLLERLKI